MAADPHDPHAELAQVLADTQSSAQPPVLDDAPRARMKANLLRRVQAAEPVGTRTVHASDYADDQAWEPFTEGVTRRVLLHDEAAGIQTVLYRLDPGCGFPAHAHTHVEECWVLEGDLLVGDYPVGAGAMHIAEVGFEHQDIIARSSALLLIRSQIYA